MELGKARDIINSYLSYSIEYEIDILGEDQEYNACGSTLGEIKEAYNTLVKEMIL